MLSELPGSTVDLVELLTTELVTSCVRRGDVGPDGQVRIDVSMPDGVVRVAVKDWGPGSGPSQPVFDGHAADSLGLVIVGRLAKAWGVSPDGRSAWFEVQRRPAPEAAGAADSRLP